MLMKSRVLAIGLILMIILTSGVPISAKDNRKTCTDPIIAGIIVLEGFGFNNGKIDLCASVDLLSGNYIKAKPGTLIFIKVHVLICIKAPPDTGFRLVAKAKMNQRSLTFKGCSPPNGLLHLVPPETFFCVAAPIIPGKTKEVSLVATIKLTFDNGTTIEDSDMEVLKIKTEWSFKESVTWKDHRNPTKRKNSQVDIEKMIFRRMIPRSLNRLLHYIVSSEPKF